MDFMKMYRFYFFILFLVGFSKINAQERTSHIYTKYVSEVISAFVKEMHKKYGLVCGASGGQMPDDVAEISVSLTAYRQASIEQARELEVQATERFVQIINAHEKIRPFLREKPFPASRVNVSIAFTKHKDFTPFADNDVEFVCHAKNRLYYLAYDPQNPYVGKDIKDEPYEEALKIVQRAKPDLVH